MSTKTWSVDDIRSLGVRVDLVTACQIVVGCGKTRAWELFHRGELPFPALRVGRKVVVPTAHLMKLLGLDEHQAA